MMATILEKNRKIFFTPGRQVRMLILEPEEQVPVRQEYISPGSLAGEHVSSAS